MGIVLSDILTASERREMDSVEALESALLAKRLQIGLNAFGRQYATEGEDIEELTLDACLHILDRINMRVQRVK